MSPFHAFTIDSSAVIPLPAVGVGYLCGAPDRIRVWAMTSTGLRGTDLEGGEPKILPIGPERWTPEGVGPLDIAATVDELSIAALGLALASAAWRRRLGAKPVEWIVLALLIASGVALMAGGHHHG